MALPVLRDRALGRATLARQFLLRRTACTPIDAVAHLVGVQAQNPRDPYLALWSRLDDFDPTSLSALIEDRSLVRIVVMRGTIHLVTADDALRLRPHFQRVLDAEIAHHSEFAPHLVGVDLAPVVAFARPFLSEQPSTGGQLRAALAERFPDFHAASLSYACRCLLPLVQVPPRGLWGRGGAVTSTPLEAWVGRSLDPSLSIDDLVVRYLAAFGPASAADVATWSKLTGMRELLDGLGARLLRLRDERGRDLFDLPDAPRPDPDTPAPVRLLPEYDNLLLSHADRSRFTASEAARFARAVGPYKGSVLVDGCVRAIWHIDTDKPAKSTVLVIEHLPLAGQQLASVEEEAGRCAGFWLPAGTVKEIRLVRLD